MTDSLCDLHLQHACTNTDPTKACRPRPQLKPPKTWPRASLTRKFSSVVSAKPLCVCVCQQEIEIFPVTDVAWGWKTTARKKRKHRSKYSLLEVIWWNTFTAVHTANFGPMQNCKLKGDMCEWAECRGRTRFGGTVRKQLFYGPAIGAPPYTWTNWPTYWNIYLMRH